MKNIRIFYLKIFLFLVVKFSIYLNRHVNVMFTILVSDVCIFVKDANSLSKLYQYLNQ